VPTGNFTVADLSGRMFFDARRRHRINLRLENLFDNEYTVQHVRLSAVRLTPADAAERAGFQASQISARRSDASLTTAAVFDQYYLI
jgi:hypothetical protein